MKTPDAGKDNCAGECLSPGSSSLTPLISIITVVRNAKDVIERTIQSVLDQPYRNIEYIIIDGASTDGTVEIIKKYEQKLAYWISEPDKGIYDAMNKAIRLMHGQGHLFLNAGDYFVSDVFGQRPSIPSFIPVFYRRFFSSVEKRQHIKDYRQGIPYCHQGILFESKGIFFDTSYRFAADYLYYLDHGYKESLPFIEAGGHVRYENTGLSMQNAALRDRELATIIRSRFGTLQFLRFESAVLAKIAVKALLSRKKKLR